LWIELMLAVEDFVGALKIEIVEVRVGCLQRSFGIDRGPGMSLSRATSAQRDDEKGKNAQPAV
jgi:hypothetical protein